jgi:quercetin dioxygenase-like cupin family protein
VSRTFNLNEIAEFSQKQGSIKISEDLGLLKKDLLKTGKFNVALICLETGQEIPSHPEPYSVCFYIINGKGTFTVGSEKFELAKGEMIYVQANEARGIQSKEKLTLLGIQDAH